MARYLILSENPALGGVLESRLSPLVRGAAVVHRRVGVAPDSPAVAEAFEELADWLERELREECDGCRAPTVVAFTDLGTYANPPLAWQLPLRGGGWGQVQGLLVLAFPEIHWVFVPGRPANVSGEIDHFHTLDGNLSDLGKIVALVQEGFTPLLDPAGLRNSVRQRLQGEANQPADSQVAGVPLRSELAVAIDDEAGYSMFHGYVAYRFGYRAHIVTTFGLMQRLFREGAGIRPSLLIEDIFLNFADRHPADFSKLSQRALTGLSPGMDRVPRRVFVSIGLGTNHREANQRFVAEARARGLDYRLRFKPLAGIFNLWQEAGMVRDWHRVPERTGAGFVWPPREVVHPDSTDRPGHSAPGRLLRVAERLIRRADRMREEVQSPAAAIYGAVLALDALELLADRTPTTGVHALTLKHHFEVVAECQFSGVQHHIQVRGRLREIDREARAISRWFGRAQRTNAALNAQMQIVGELLRVFRHHNQFDEEQECLARSRRLHHSLWVRQRPWRVCLLPILRYSELLLLRLSNFFWAVAAWSLGFTLIFWLLDQFRDRRIEAAVDRASQTAGTVEQTARALSQALSAVLGSEVKGPELTWQLATVAAVLVGIAHFGLLTAHLYSLTTRK